MLYLVEGLNGSGKSNWISNMIDIDDDLLIHTPYANPRRSEYTTHFKMTNLDMQSYLFGIYESICYSILDAMRLPLSQNVYWDRTFISAYIYGTLGGDAFNDLINIYKAVLPMKYVRVVYMATPWNICKERTRANKDKSYVNPNLDWELTDNRFNQVLGILSDRGFDVRKNTEGIPCTGSAT